MIVAYFRPIVQDEVMERLRQMGVPGASLSKVHGFGLEADAAGKETYGPQVSPYKHTVKLEVICPDDREAELVDTIAQTAQTGQRGDGKIYVLPVQRAVDIRSYEAGGAAHGRA